MSMKNQRNATWYFLMIFAIITNYTHAQEFPEISPPDHHFHRMGIEGGQGSTGIGQDYDIKYYRLNLYINPDTTLYVRGNVTSYFETLSDNFSLIKFDFQSDLIVDSIKYRGVKLNASSYVEVGDTLEISLPNSRPKNFLDSITVHYRGVPVAGPSGTGYVRAQHNSTRNYIYTLSEPYSARNWWPCKLELADKADSLDLIIKTPSGFRAAGNGTLVSETTSGGYTTATWKHRYPIPAYLVCTAVANYDVYNSAPVTIGGVSMPVMHYVFPEHNNLTARNNFDKVRSMLSTFSTYFGEYPFKQEKYGHYQFGFSGGMEHSTFSGMNRSTFDQTSDWSTIAHELGHQWFGDKVTTRSWQHIWVNEGFAKFTEIIAAEKIAGLADVAAHRLSIKNNAIANKLQTTFRTDTSSLNTIFSPSVYIYDRGAMILNMLRLLLGDAKFFTAIQNYTSDPTLAYKNAVTDDVKRHMENVSGIDLADFFNDWIFNNGHASYVIQYGINSNYIGIQFDQSRVSGSSAPYFDMPLQLKINGPAGVDTTIVVYDDDGILHYVENGVLIPSSNNILGYNLSFVPQSLSFDPGNLSMAVATMSVNATLPIRNIIVSGKASISRNTITVNATYAGSIEKLILEKSSDGAIFFPIKEYNEIKEKDFLSLSIDDMFPSREQNYYRARLILGDGSIAYSNILKLTNSASKEIARVFPNPATGSFYVTVPVAEKEAIVQIINSAGELIESRAARGGNAEFYFQTDRWKPGVYIVRIIYSHGEEQRRLIIQ